MLSKFPDFEKLYTSLTVNKGSSVFRSNSSSQACQDEYAVCDFAKPEGGQNEIINSAENAPDTEEKHDKETFDNIATFNWERLEGKFVSNNVINLSRKNFSEDEIPILSKCLKFISTAIKKRQQS